MTRYALPDLRYDYGALEPHLSGKLIELHHDRHHRLYVENANRTIEQLIEARRRNDFEHIAELERKLAFNVSGHILHCIYWQNLRPDGGGLPHGELARAIDRDFGGFDAFRNQLVKVAATVMGSGWAALVYDPLSRRLGTTQIYDHQDNVTQAGVPLLVLDAWEHAWYVQYHADKARYFQAIWNVWNWEDVAARYAAAQELDLRLENALEVPREEVPAVH